MFNNIAITVSDDEPDELGRMRMRVKKKRKKGRSRSDSYSCRYYVRFVLRYWPIFLLAASALLLFEVSKVGGKLGKPIAVRSALKAPEKKISVGNLNRLDPTTRVVGGVRERCLRILPPEELQMLNIPLRNDSESPLKNVMYITGAGTKHVGVDTKHIGQHQEDTRFNLFTGYQTFNERERTFELNESKSIHCGFYNEDGGFRMSERDKVFMQTCKIVVSTCAFGGGDDLFQPIGMTETSLQKVCYVAFWDEITLSVQESEGNKLPDDHFFGKWRVVIVKDLPFSDQRLNGKIPKMLGHRLFPHARFSIWVDSKSQIRRDPLGVLEALLWRENYALAISEHGARSSLYDEAKAVVHKHKATAEEVEVQLSQYRRDGMPYDKKFNGKKALNEASIIVREHTSETNLFMCVWFNEVVRFTSRDQLSFPYVLWRLKLPKNINMFPVCTRKDLVNSIGHIRKAKPLS